MGNDSTEYGPNLYRFLADYWRATGTNQNAWCDAHPGIHAPTVSRWRTGTEPRVAAYRAVADALGRPILDILQIAGVITADEAKGRAVTPTTAPSIDDALRLDDTVPASVREALASMLQATRDVAAGRVVEVTGTGSKRRRTRV